MRLPIDLHPDLLPIFAPQVPTQKFSNACLQGLRRTGHARFGQGKQEIGPVNGDHLQALQSHLNPVNEALGDPFRQGACAQKSFDRRALFLIQQGDVVGGFISFQVGTQHPNPFVHQVLEGRLDHRQGEVFLLRRFLGGIKPAIGAGWVVLQVTGLQARASFELIQLLLQVIQLVRGQQADF